MRRLPTDRCRQGCYPSRRSAMGRSATGHCRNGLRGCRSFDRVRAGFADVAQLVDPATLPPAAQGATPRERTGPGSDQPSPKRPMATAQARAHPRRRRRAPLPGGSGKARCRQCSRDHGYRPRQGRPPPTRGERGGGRFSRLEVHQQSRGSGRLEKPLAAVRQRRPHFPLGEGAGVPPISTCARRAPPSSTTSGTCRWVVHARAGGWRAWT